MVSRRDVFKFAYRAHEIQISDELQTFIQGTLSRQLDEAWRAEMRPYKVIDDDEAAVRILEVEGKQFAFMDVFRNQVARIGDLRPIQDFSQIREPWAYAFAFPGRDGTVVYSLRKTSRTKVGADARDAAPRLMKRFSAAFNTNERRLEFVPYPTVTLDSEGAAFYFDERFYVLNKAQFDQVVGLEEDFAATAIAAIDEVAASNLIEGLELLRSEVGKSKRLMRRLANLMGTEGLTSVTPERLQRMAEVAEYHEIPFRVNDDGRVVIQDERDLDAVVKLLEDYFLRSPQTEFDYGTRAKTRIKGRR